MCRKIPATSELTNIYVLSNEGPTLETLSLFSSHRKNWFAARCEYLHLIKKNSQQANKHCEFFFAMTGKEALDFAFTYRQYTNLYTFRFVYVSAGSVPTFFLIYFRYSIPVYHNAIKKCHTRLRGDIVEMRPCLFPFFVEQADKARENSCA